MECINFDKKFLDFTNEWVDAHQGEYENMETLEEDMPRIYMHFLNSPASWLKGLTPGSYFTQYDDPKVLVDWLEEYCKKAIPVPDLLQERIVEVGLPCAKRLLALLEDPAATREGKMTAIGLLRDLESELPLKLYIRWQLNRQEEDELSENAIESLKEMGKVAIAPMERAMDQANLYGQEALLDALVRPGASPKVYEAVVGFFKEFPKKRAVLAGYLGKLGDMRALDLLKEAALEPELAYLDYIEIRNAIEALGGDCPPREFPEDDSYEALRQLQ